MALIGAWTVALALAACGPAREASAPLGSRSYAATTPTVSAETSLAGPATGGVYSSCDAVASDGTNFVAACWKDRDAFTLPIRAANGTVGAGQLLWTLPPSAPGNPYGRTNSASRIALSGSKSDYVAAAVQWSKKHMGG